MKDNLDNTVQRHETESLKLTVTCAARVCTPPSPRVSWVLGVCQAYRPGPTQTTSHVPEKPASAVGQSVSGHVSGSRRPDLKCQMKIRKILKVI